MATTNNPKSVPLPDNIRADGIAVDAKGIAWLASKRVNKTSGYYDGGQVFSIAPDSDTPTPYTLPDILPERGGYVQPEYIALQTKEDGSVEAIWVSDLNTGYVYRLEPGDKSGAHAKKIDLGKGSETRGIAWDEKNKLVWVADEGNQRLLAVNASTHEVNNKLIVSRPSSDICQLAVTAHGVWFTENGSGKVCFYDPAKPADNPKSVREFDFKVYSTDASHSPSSYPYGLGVHENRLWIVASGPSELWAIDGIDKVETLKNEDLRRVKSLDKGTKPEGIVVDNATGKLWISLSKAHRVVQLTKTGAFEQYYDLNPNSASAGIAYSTRQQQLWVSDSENSQVFRFALAAQKPISIEASPSQDRAAPGKPFQYFTITVSKGGTPVEEGTVVTLDIVGSGKALFSNGQSETTVRTETGGKAIVHGLKAATNAVNDTTFTITAKIEGMEKGTEIFTGHIGAKQISPEEQPKGISLQAGLRADGIAIAPDGTAWVAVTGSEETTEGQIVSIAPGGGASISHKLPAIPKGRGNVRPAYVALQTNDANKVEAIWVSDLRTRYVYRLEPGDKDGNNAKPIDLGEGSETRGIAWDHERKLIWVADEGADRLVAIDSDRHVKDDHWTIKLGQSSAIQQVAVTKAGVWFTEYGTGKVCFLDAGKKKVLSFGFGLGDNDGAQYPYGIAVHGNRLWVTASKTNELWSLSDITNLTPRPLEKITSLGDRSGPHDIAVDSAGYLWISLRGAKQMAQLTNTGMVIEKYDLPDSGSPRGIAYAAGQDQIWISNWQPEHSNHAVYLFTPIDKIDPAGNKKISIRADPDSGSVAAKGNPFDKWKVLTTEDGNRAKRHVILTIDPQSKAALEVDGHKSSIIAETDAKGEFVVDTLKAADDAAEKDHFAVTATTRGFGEPVPIYTGYIGKTIHIKSIAPINDEEDFASFGQPFHDLEVKLEGTDVDNAKVIFEITAGSERAAFKSGQDRTVAATENGLARAELKALNVPGIVKVSAHPDAGHSNPVSFRDRNVVPLPRNIVPPKTGMTIPQGEASKPYTITVTGKYNGQEYNVPGAKVEVSLQPVPNGVTDARFVEAAHPNKKLTDPSTIFITTNKHGEASIGCEAQYYILTDDTGHLTVQFKITAPLQDSHAVEPLKLDVVVREASL